MFRVAQRAREIEYAIRDVLVHARELQRKGRKIVYLNIGDPVKYGFDTPPHVKEALKDAVDEGTNWYSESEGLKELREAICEKERRVNRVYISPDDVLVTSGISEAILFVMGAMVEPGDEVLVPGPCYPPYASYIKFFGGRAVPYRTIEAEGWRADLEDLRAKVNRKSTAIVIVNPNNPCGAVYDRGILKGILDIAAENSLLVLSDEIYDRITYEESFVSTASIAGEIPIVGLNGFSKTYLMTGWRLGYVYFRHPKGEFSELKHCVEKESRVRLCPNTPAQKAAIQALNGPEDHIRDMVARLRARRDFTMKRLAEIPGLSCARPEGAFYIFPKVAEIGRRWKTDEEFALSLLEATGVLVVHGSGFGVEFGSGHFRAVFLPDEQILGEAFDLLEGFMKAP